MPSLAERNLFSSFGYSFPGLQSSASPAATGQQWPSYYGQMPIDFYQQMFASAQTRGMVSGLPVGSNTQWNWQTMFAPASPQTSEPSRPVEPETAMPTGFAAGPPVSYEPPSRPVAAQPPPWVSTEGTTPLYRYGTGPAATEPPPSVPTSGTATFSPYGTGYQPTSLMPPFATPPAAAPAKVPAQVTTGPGPIATQPMRTSQSPASYQRPRPTMPIQPPQTYEEWLALKGQKPSSQENMAERIFGPTATWATSGRVRQGDVVYHYPAIARQYANMGVPKYEQDLRQRLRLKDNEFRHLTDVGDKIQFEQWRLAFLLPPMNLLGKNQSVGGLHVNYLYSQSMPWNWVNWHNIVKTLTGIDLDAEKVLERYWQEDIKGKPYSYTQELIRTNNRNHRFNTIILEEAMNELRRKYPNYTEQQLADIRDRLWASLWTNEVHY